MHQKYAKNTKGQSLLSLITVYCEIHSFFVPIYISLVNNFELAHGKIIVSAKKRTLTSKMAAIMTAVSKTEESETSMQLSV